MPLNRPLSSRDRFRQDYVAANPEYRQNTAWSRDPIEAATDRAHEWVARQFEPRNRYERPPVGRQPGERPNTPWSDDPIAAATDRAHDAVVGGIDRLRRRMDPKPVREEATRPRRIRRDLTVRVRESEPEFETRPRMQPRQTQPMGDEFGARGDEFDLMGDNQQMGDDQQPMGDEFGAQDQTGGEQQHIVMVTISDADQPGNTTDRRIKVGGATDQEAIARAEAFYTKQGKEVHDAVYIKVFGAPPEDAGYMGDEPMGDRSIGGQPTADAGYYKAQPSPQPPSAPQYTY